MQPLARSSHPHHNQKHRTPFAPLLDVTWVAPDDCTKLAATIRTQRPAALFLEPIQGEGGIGELSREFLQTARDVCSETGTVLVHDEIQTGCGRTGTFLAAQYHDITPDVVTLAKPIGAGLPMGVCIRRCLNVCEHLSRGMRLLIPKEKVSTKHN